MRQYEREWPPAPPAADSNTAAGASAVPQQASLTQPPLPWYLEDPRVADGRQQASIAAGVGAQQRLFYAAPVDAAFSVLRLAASAQDIELNMIRSLLPAASSADPLEYGPGWCLYQAL